MITDAQYDELLNELAEDSADDEPSEVFAPVTSLWQLQCQCTACSATPVGRALQAEARLNAVIAATALTGACYGEQGWPDAVQDLIALQKQYRREEWRRSDLLDPHQADLSAWQQADAQLLERINHALRSYYEQLAADIEAEQEQDMPRHCNRCNQQLPGAVGVCTCGCPEFRITDSIDHQPSPINPQETTMRTATAKRPQQSPTRPEDETFSAWQAALASHLPHWDDRLWQERNDELLELYHNGVSVADAVAHYQMRKRIDIPETQEQAAAKEAAAVNGEATPSPTSKRKSRKQRTSNAQRPTSNTEGAEASAAEQLVEISVSDIVPAPWNPRTEFDAGRLQELADSLKKVGLLQPIVVRPLAGVAEGQSGTVPKYELVAGERRWRAAKLARLTTIAARVVDITEEEAMEACVAENWERDDLNPLDRARSVKLLIEGAGLTQAAAAKRLGLKDAATVSNILFPLELPPAWQRRIVSQEITATHARHLRAWLGREKVLETAAAELDRHLQREGRPPTVKEFEKMVIGAAEKHSRPLQKPTGPWDRNACHFGLTKKRKEELDVQKVPQTWGGGPVLRAFNVTLWSKLQREAKAKQKQEKGETDAGGGAKTKAAKPANCKPYEGEVCEALQRWLCCRIAINLPGCTGEQILRAVLLCSGSEHWLDVLRDGLTLGEKPLSGGDLRQLILETDWKALDDGVMLPMLKQSLEQVGLERYGVYGAPDLDALLATARVLSIDVAADFTPPAELLSKWSDNLLRKMPQGKKAPEDLKGETLAEWLAANWPAGSKLPKEVSKLLK